MTIKQLRGMPSGARPLMVLFIVNGAMLSAWFVWISTVKRNLGLSDAQLGTALWGLPAGLLAGILASAWLIKRIGVNRTLAIGVVGYCATLVGPGLAGNEVMLALALAAPGFFNGIMEPPAYLVADELKAAWGRREIVGYMQAAFAAAQVLSPLLAAQAILLGVPVWGYLGITGAVGVVLAILACRRLPAAPPPAAEHSTWRRSPRWWGWVLTVSLLAIAGFVTEGIWAEWHGTYLSGSGIDASLATAAYAYPLFQVAAVLSRTAQPKLTDRYGSFSVVVASALVVLGGATLIVTAGSLAVGLCGAAVLGLGAGPISSIAFSAAGSDPKAVTVVSSLAYVGLLASPPLIGYLASLITLRTALLGLAVMGVVMLLTAPVVRHKAPMSGTAT